MFNALYYRVLRDCEAAKKKICKFINLCADDNYLINKSFRYKSKEKMQSEYSKVDDFLEYIKKYKWK